MNPYKRFVFLIFTALGWKEQIKKQEQLFAELPRPERLCAIWILMANSNGPATTVRQVEDGPPS